MSSLTWKDHFKERLVGLEEPREGSYLELALEEGRLTSKEYLEWATATFLMPVLKPEYFTDHQPDPAWLKRAQYKWGPTMIPVGQWDDVLIVACLEKPHEVQALTCCVLADRENLTEWWNKLSDSQEMLGDWNAAPPPNLSFSGVSLARNEGSLTDAPAADAPILPDAAPLELPEDPNVVKLSEIPDLDAMEATQIGEPARPTLDEPLILERDEPLVLEQEAAPILEPAPAAEPVVAAAPTPAASPLVAKVAPVENKTLTLDSKEKTKLAALSNKKDTVKHYAMKAFKELSAFYPEAMVLLHNDTGTHLVPAAWTENLKPVGSLQKIPLDEPSLFRIVHTTEKAYHGYVVANDVNDQFFKRWSKDASPEVVTAVPLFYNGHCYGVLMGFSDKEKTASQTYLQLIRLLDKAGADLSQALGSKPAEVRAA